MAAVSDYLICLVSEWVYKKARLLEYEPGKRLSLDSYTAINASFVDAASSCTNRNPAPGSSRSAFQIPEEVKSMAVLLARDYRRPLALVLV